MESLNQSFFLFINYFAGKNNTVDYLSVLLSEYSQYLFFITVFYLYFINKEKFIILLSILVSLSSLLFNKTIILFYFHNRPFMDHIGVILEPHRASSSFPSNHTAFMFSIACTLFVFKETRKYGIFLLIIAWIGGLSRVFVGIHYPFDIMGSFIVSMGSTMMIYAMRAQLFSIRASILNRI